jgi:hypothetical protein
MEDAILQCVLQVTQKPRDEHGSGLLLHFGVVGIQIGEVMETWKMQYCNVCYK